MEKPTIEQAREVLRKYWHYGDFRPGQAQAIEGVLQGKDSLIIMPTGGGKSLCYQVPAMLLPGVTLVVSPLISLMKDQVDTLAAIGLPATFINSTLPAGEMMARLEAVERGETKLVYVAPERFDSEMFQERIARVRVSLLAVDEAHCVSQWGHDFRPSYLRVGRVRETLGNPPVAALTATATDEVRRDIVRQLELRDPEVLVTGFDRRNLSWHVLRAKNDSEKDRILLRLLRGRDGSAIVYASTRKSVDALTALLSGVGIGAVGYHAGLPDGDRKRIQEAFMSGEAAVVVATNAFGMGIDKPDVRLVVHYNMPGTLEAYYQEAGRAGRDGAPADCVLLHAYPDRFTHEFFIEQSHPPKAVVQEVMRELRSRSGADGVFTLPIAEFARTLSTTKGDRQVYSALRILEEHDLVRQSPAGSAPTARVRLIATPKRIREEVTAEARPAELKLLRGLWKRGGGEQIYRGAELDWRDLARLTGSRTRAVELLDALQDESFLEWQAWNGGEGVQILDQRTPPSRLPIDWRSAEARKQRETKKLQQMQGYAYHERCRRGYLLRYFGDPAAMRECGACDNCMEHPAPAAAAVAAASDSRTRPAKPADGAEDAAERALTGAQAELYDELRSTRRELADRAGLPPYFILSEATLRTLALDHPTTPEALLQIPGIGARTLERFGLPLLAVLRRRAGEPELTALPELVAAPAPKRGGTSEPPTAEEAALYGRLRELRSRLARDAGLPAYCIFPDRTLIELARTRPTNENALLAVPGVGPAKLERYAAPFLDLLRSAEPVE